MKKKYAWIAAIVVLLLILIDQIIKFWVKTNMTLGETIPLLGQWFNLHFVENEGMAFGISFGKQMARGVLQTFPFWKSFVQKMFGKFFVL